MTEGVVVLGSAEEVGRHGVSSICDSVVAVVVDILRAWCV